MRSNRRPTGSPRKRAVPVRSRLTIRAAAHAPLARGVGLQDALKASRDALNDIQKQLDALLASVRSPHVRPEAESIDRLARSNRRADAAMARLTKA